MPGDLFSSDSKDDSLVASPESQTPKPDSADVAALTTSESNPREFTIHRDETSESDALQFLGGGIRANGANNLHPYVQTLSISNLESCVALENAIFPEQERCSREKVALPSVDFTTSSSKGVISKVNSLSFPPLSPLSCSLRSRIDFRARIFKIDISDMEFLSSCLGSTSVESLAMASLKRYSSGIAIKKYYNPKAIIDSPAV